MASVRSTTIARTLKRLVPTTILHERITRRIFADFADKTGLVYFGYVDQRNDEHRLVRGLTASARQHDNHYCIGSYDNYDVTLVDRTDTLYFPGKSPKPQHWTIMAFDLHRPVDLPHLFLGLHTHGEAFYAQLFTKYPHFNQVPLTTALGYNTNFLQHYAVYATPTQALSASRLFNPAITAIIAQHFNGLTIEINDNCLYVYAEHQRASSALLERMVKYGVWLAKSLDEVVEL